MCAQPTTLVKYATGKVQKYITVILFISLLQRLSCSNRVLYVIKFPTGSLVDRMSHNLLVAGCHSGVRQHACLL